MQIDHFMWVAPDLNDGIAEIERLTGERPVEGGAHEGLGTRNALLGLGESVYLEILSPDPAQTLKGTMGEVLANLGQSGLVAWACRSDRLTDLGKKVKQTFADWQDRRPVDVSREKPDGTRVAWQLLMPGLSDAGVPFFIDWLDSPHPTQSLDHRTIFRTLEIQTPRAEQLREIVGLEGISIVPANSISLTLNIESPHASVALGSIQPYPEQIRI